MPPGRILHKWMISEMAPVGRCPVRAGLPCGVSDADRRGWHCMRVAAAFPLKKPHAWMVDEVSARDVGHPRRRKTYLRSAEPQEMHSTSS